MQFAYTFAGMAYQLSYSYEKNADPKDVNRFINAEQKIALSIFGFALGKFIFSFAFDKLLTPAEYKIKLYTISGICVLALFIQILISSLSYRNYSSGWFFAAFFFGVQSAAVTTKFEFQSINEVVERDEEHLDTVMFGKVIGTFLIFFAAMFFRMSFVRLYNLNMTIQLIFSPFLY